VPDYRRAFAPGGSFFFTLVTERRAPILCSDLARGILHDAIVECAGGRPFVLDAWVLLPDHLHAMWTLPAGDGDFSTRWAFIKARFTREWLGRGGAEQRRIGSRVANRRRGVWQRRFWEHHVRDAEDRENHLNYLHHNPVKHGLVACPHQWPFSTFARWVERGVYEPQWQCSCEGRKPTPLRWDGLDTQGIEMGE
jgi:putative transposase